MKLRETGGIRKFYPFNLARSVLLRPGQDDRADAVTESGKQGPTIDRMPPRAAGTMAPAGGKALTPDLQRN